MRSWVKHNKLEDMTSLLIYDLNNFTPTGTLCFYKEEVDSEVVIMMPTTPLKEQYNLYRYIQHLILKSVYNYDDEEFDNPIDKENWLLQTRGKYMKFVVYYFLHCNRTQKLFQPKTWQFQKRYQKGGNSIPCIERQKIL